VALLTIITPTISGAGEILQSAFLNKSYWEKFNWDNVQKSTLYNSKEWTQTSPQSSKVESIYKSLGEVITIYEGDINFAGKKRRVLINKTKTERSPSDTIWFVIDGWDDADINRLKNADINVIDRWRDILRKQFGQETVYYDGSEKDSFILRTYRWDIGNTVISLTGYDNFINISYENAETSDKRRLKPLIYLTCEFGYKNPDNKLAFAIDEASSQVKDMGNNVLKIKVTTTENNFRLMWGDNMTIDINRLDGKISGWIYDHGERAPINGMCDKLNPIQPKF
jgi:hypothetical protein